MSVPAGEQWSSDGTADAILSDAVIAALTPEQRRTLIRRLQPPPDYWVPRPRFVQVQRRLRIALMVGGALAMIPWLVYLGLTLPVDYRAQHWSLAWIGYDIMMIVIMGCTAYLGWKRRAILLLPAFGLGLMLLIDAWFDIVTAEPDDVWVSVATAVCAEIPLAILQLSGAFLLFRYLVLAHPLHDSHESPWRAPLPF